MKKIVFIYMILISLMVPIFGYAMNPGDFLEKTSTHFQPGCYEYYLKIPENQLQKYKNYHGEVDTNIDPKSLLIYQNGFSLPFRKDSKQNKYLAYTTSFFPKDSKKGQENFFSYLNDDSDETFVHINIANNESEIIIELNERVIPGEFSFQFQYLSKYYFTSYFISEDGKNYTKVSYPELDKFTFTFMKIVFQPLEDTIQKEKIKITELSFLKNTSVFLFQSFFDKDIEIYASYKCELENTNKELSIPEAIDLGNAPKKLYLTFEKNPKYNYYSGLSENFMKENDPDNDLILNRYDNCRGIANKDQKDDDNDNIGNVCDNCKDIANFKQIDNNKNGVGDLCEDSDNDGIIGHKDNCIGIANFDQVDNNKNGIGDFCEDSDYDNVVYINDNCPHVYNPYQIDTDGDLIGDACDTVDDSIKDTKDIWNLLLMSIGIIGGLGLFLWLGRINNK